MICSIPGVHRDFVAQMMQSEQEGAQMKGFLSGFILMGDIIAIFLFCLPGVDPTPSPTPTYKNPYALKSQCSSVTQQPPDP